MRHFLVHNAGTQGAFFHGGRPNQIRARGASRSVFWEHVLQDGSVFRSYEKPCPTISREYLVTYVVYVLDLLILDLEEDQKPP